MEKILWLGILIASCSSLTEGRLGLRRRSIFDDPFFMRPWTTFDMMTKDFEDPFRNDPFFNDDDFEDFFHQPLERPDNSQSCKKTKDQTDISNESKCQKQSGETDLIIPQLAARVVKNDNKQFNFAMNLKGFDRKEISVKVEDDFLKISGKKSCKEDSKRCTETSYFRYQYLLPKHSDISKVKASFSKDGYLIVDVPKLPKIEDASSGLKIEELDEEYVPKLKEHVAKVEKKTQDSGKKDEADDDVTIEEIPPTKS